MQDPVRDLSRPRQTPPTEQPAQERLERALADIREDAQVRAPVYARETVVPEGGE